MKKNWVGTKNAKRICVSFAFMLSVFTRISLFVASLKFTRKVLNAQAFLGEQHNKVID